MKGICFYQKKSALASAILDDRQKWGLCWTRRSRAARCSPSGSRTSAPKPMDLPAADWWSIGRNVAHWHPVLNYCPFSVNLGAYLQNRTLGKEIMNILVKIIHSNESLNFTSGPKWSLLYYSFNNNVRYVWMWSEYTWHIVNSTRTWFTTSICMNWLFSS